METEPEDFLEDERLRKAERLRERREFLETRGEGSRAQGDHFVVYARNHDLAYSRLGVTASTDVGPAYVRNWWKRRIREIFRRNKTDYPVGYDYVVIVRASAERADYGDLRDELLEILDEAAEAATP